MSRTWFRIVSGTLRNNLGPCCIIWSLALAAIGSQTANQASLSITKLLHQPGRQERPCGRFPASEATGCHSGSSLWNAPWRQPLLFETRDRRGHAWLGKCSTPWPSEKTVGSSPRHLCLISPSEFKGPKSSLLARSHPQSCTTPHTLITANGSVISPHYFLQITCLHWLQSLKQCQPALFFSTELLVYLTYHKNEVEMIPQL